MTTNRFVLCVLMGTFFAGCSSAGSHRAAVAPEGDRLTVGTVQREVRVGMTGSEVASVLGSPNVVTTDDQRREVWVYDKISTERVYSADVGGISALILGGWAGGSGLAAGGGSTAYSKSAGAESTSQQTLTIIISFDHQKKVRDFAYHASRF